jgi:hypothetical protein
VGRKYEKERELGRPGPRWEDNFKKLILKGVGCVGVDWICVSQDRVQWWALVNVVMNLQVP